MFEIRNISEETFAELYFSNKEIFIENYMESNIMFICDHTCLMSTYVYDKYLQFIIEVEENRPLLAQLK